MRDNIAAALAMIDDDTKVIPGHGPLATKAELQAFHDRIAATIEIVRKQKDAGKSLEEIQAAGFPEEYAKFTGFMPVNVWMGAIFASLND